MTREVERSAAQFTVIIPARMASTRLPNKPLADIHGLPMIVRVAKQALQSAARQVVVATDDLCIQAACAAHGIDSILTRADHPSGSDRLAEATQILNLSATDIVVNVQGDEPFIDPALINATAALLQDPSNAACVMGTAAHPIDNWADFLNPNVVKLVRNGAGHAQYFSRAPIPYNRSASDASAAFWANAASPHESQQALRHIGIYSYTVAFLQKYPLLSVAPTEALESLEQLRVLWHGYAIAVNVTHTAPAAGVDTPEDLERARAHAQTLGL